MTIDILELKRICEKYNKDPLDLRIVFDYYCVKLDANFLGDRIWRRHKAISYTLFETLSIAQFESLVDDFMDEFIRDVKKQGELVVDLAAGNDKETQGKLLHLLAEHVRR